MTDSSSPDVPSLGEIGLSLPPEAVLSRGLIDFVLEHGDDEGNFVLSPSVAFEKLVAAVTMLEIRLIQLEAERP